MYYLLFKKACWGKWVEEGREFRFRGDLYSQESTFPLVSSWCDHRMLACLHFHPRSLEMLQVTSARIRCRLCDLKYSLVSCLYGLRTNLCTFFLYNTPDEIVFLKHFLPKTKITESGQCCDRSSPRNRSYPDVGGWKSDA